MRSERGRRWPRLSFETFDHSARLVLQTLAKLVSKRNSLVIVTACLLTIAVIWLFLPVAVPKSDAARYERWKQTSHLTGRVMWWERSLPQSLVRPFHLSALDQKYWDEHARLGDALVASGFLTNATITVDAAPTNTAQRAQAIDRFRNDFRKAFQGRDEWEFWVGSNVVVVTCRPQSIFLCRQALQE